MWGRKQRLIGGGWFCGSHRYSMHGGQPSGGVRGEGTELWSGKRGWRRECRGRQERGDVGRQAERKKERKKERWIKGREVWASRTIGGPRGYRSSVKCGGVD